MKTLKNIINPLSMEERLETKMAVEKAIKSSIRYIPIKEIKYKKYLDKYK